tara:strand:+ start:2350 stop:3309 length:960 start_codon:yes stop_codon:yes gene_type:complete
MNIKNKILNSAKNTLSKEINSIRTIKDIFDETFYNAVSVIYKTKGRVIVTGIGKSAHIGGKFSATLTSTGTPSYFIHAAEASHGDLGGIKRNDCVIAISNSGESNELNDIINYTKRFNVTLISISGNKKSNLYKNSLYGIVYKKPKEACPLNLAPTSSTTMSLVITDCIALALLEIKGFKSKNFKSLHPGGNIGKDLKTINEIMHHGKSLPLAKLDEKMSTALIKMTKKSFGCVGVVNKRGLIVGIITDGDLRRQINSSFINKKASEIMTKKPTFADKNMLVGEALNLMNKLKITSLFVCIKKKPVGIIHIHDLLRLSS